MLGYREGKGRRGERLLYDSLVSSGEIKFLDYEIQQTIQDILNMIKRHNHYLMLTIENRNRDGKISKITIRYYELLEQYEQKLLEKIPCIMSRVEKNFKPDYLEDRPFDTVMSGSSMRGAA